jgi:hypothetical protein
MPRTKKVVNEKVNIIETKTDTKSCSSCQNKGKDEKEEKKTEPKKR